MKLTSFTVVLVLPALVSGSALATSYNQKVLNKNPLYYWTFDEMSGNAIDQVAAGGATDDLSPFGAATRVASTSTTGGVSLGNAASFNATDGTIFQSAELSGAGNISRYAIEFWTRLGSESQRYLMDVSTNSPAVIQGFIGNSFELFGPSGRTDAAGPTTVNDGNWHHVVIGSDQAANEHTIIIDNGAPLTVSSTFASTLSQGKFTLGGADLGGGIQVINGQMDEVALYDLSGFGSLAAPLSQIASHYTVANAPVGMAIPNVAVTAVNTGDLSYGARLTDGVKSLNTGDDGDDWSGLPPTSTGVSVANHITVGTGPTVTAEFDLQAEYVLDRIDVSYMTAVNFAVPKPGLIKLWYSDTPGVFNLLPDETYNSAADGWFPDSNTGWLTVEDATAEISGTGRYVKIEFVAGLWDGVNQEWIGINEVVFFGTPVAVPEPAGLTLIGLGLAAMAGFARRNRTR